MARIKKVPHGADHHLYPVQKKGDTEEEGNPAERNDDEESKVTNETGDNEKKRVYPMIMAMNQRQHHRDFHSRPTNMKI